MLLFHAPCKRRKYRTVKSCFSVNVSGCHLLPDHGLTASCIHRYVKSQTLNHIQRIDLGLFQSLISRYHRNSEKVNRRALARHQNCHCIIVPRITVQNNFCLLPLHLFSSIISLCIPLLCSLSRLPIL